MDKHVKLNATKTYASEANAHAIREEMERHLCSIAGDVPDADTAETHLEGWLYDNHPEFSRAMSLKESRAFIAVTVNRYF